MISLVPEASQRTFIPGVELGRLYYEEVIRPLLSQHFPGVPHSAGLLGEGSDVLGFDNERSMDHNWGPRGVLFFSERDYQTLSKKIDRMLRRQLPYSFLGFSTNFTPPRQNYLVQQMELVSSGPVNHLIKIFSVPAFCDYYLGFDMQTEPTIQDWITFPQQALCELTAGAVYHDGLGTLEDVRRRLAYYPDDVWRYMMMCQWTRIANELSYQARSGERDDELGSRIIAARMIDEIVRMSFLMERTYMPYSKWRGSAFIKLEMAAELQPILLDVLNETCWRKRQTCLGRAYQVLAREHNALGLTRQLSTELSDFHGRGYTVLDVGPFIHELKRSIKNRKLKNMRYAIGSVDQFINHARINHENYLHRALTTIIQ